MFGGIVFMSLIDVVLMSYRIQDIPAVASAGVLEGISVEESKNL